jgi:hypothetical protein
MRKFVIGDIRGDLYLLKKLLDRIGPGEDDVVIFLGSYLGPGGNSKDVLDYLLEIRKKLGTWIFLKGCYEYMFLQCIGTKPSKRNLNIWRAMGGHEVFRSYAAQEKLIIMTPPNGEPSHPAVFEIPLHIPEPHIRFMEQELHCMFTDNLVPFIACHNGYYAGVAGTENLSEEFCVFTPRGWEKEDKLVIPGKEIVYSHVPLDRPLITKGKIGIDLGAGLGGKLCAVEMYTRKFEIVSS